MSEIYDILSNHNCKPQYKGEWVFISCPFHNEDKPSLGIKQDFFKCFGCGKAGPLSYLLEELGIIERPEIDVVATVKDNLLNSIVSNLSSLNGIPQDAEPFNLEFRGITKETFNFFKVFTSKFFPDEIVFPIYDTNDLKGLVRKPLNGKYKINFYGKYTPYNFYNCFANNLIVVEGVFDALSVWQAGYENVCAILGTGNVFTFSKFLRRMKAKNVNILFDGDVAGNSAAKKLNNIYPNSTIIEMPDDTDPNNLSNLKEFLKRNIER
jgi:DNA primase